MGSALEGSTIPFRGQSAVIQSKTITQMDLSAKICNPSVVALERSDVMAIIQKQIIDRLSLVKVMVTGCQLIRGGFHQGHLSELKTDKDNFRNSLLVITRLCTQEKCDTLEHNAEHGAIVAEMTTQLDQLQVVTAFNSHKPELPGWVKKLPVRPYNPQNAPRSFEAIMQGPRHSLSIVRVP